jgi:hypothetical protein
LSIIGHRGTKKPTVAAAAKAGVFHFPQAILAEVSTLLASEAPGTSSIACVSGYETACDDLEDAFVRAKWPDPDVIPAAV